MSADLTSLALPHHIFWLRRSIVHRGRVVDKLMPAFPRYVLIPFDQCWEVLRRVWRLIGVVTFGEEVARVRPESINFLLSRCVAPSVLATDPIPEPFACGDAVRVGGYGPISGHDAIYDGVVGDGKLRLMFDWMGRSVPIDIDKRDVFSIATRSTLKNDVRRRRKRRRSHGRRRKKHSVPLVGS